MSVQDSLGAARRAWDRLWDHGKTIEKQKEKTKESKKTIRRRTRDNETTEGGAWAPPGDRSMRHPGELLGPQMQDVIREARRDKRN